MEKIKDIDPRFIIDRINNDGELTIHISSFDDVIYDIEVSDILFKEEVDSDERKKERV